MNKEERELLAKCKETLFEYADADEFDTITSGCDVYQLIEDVDKHLRDTHSRDADFELIDGKPKPSVLRGYI